MNPLIARFANNKHTTTAAVVYVGTVVACRFGSVWFPAHKPQFDASEEIVKSAAAGYGLLMAGDSQAPATSTTIPKP